MLTRLGPLLLLVAYGCSGSSAPGDASTGGATAGSGGAGGMQPSTGGGTGIGTSSGGTSPTGGQSSANLESCEGVQESARPVALNGAALATNVGGAGGAPPICACDGRLFAEDDVPEGVGVDPYGYCLLPGGSFGCGAEACDVGAEYCSGMADHSNASQVMGHACLPLGECTTSLDSAEAACACLGLVRGCSLAEVEDQTVLYHLAIAPR